MTEQPSEEEMKAMQEKVSNMSPEELKEFQKQQCIFCQIISGKVASKKVYEDDVCFGILDINPANPGHVLLMPKEHYPLMPLIPEEIIGHLFMVAKAFSRIMLTAVSAEGTNIFIANGSAAGQRAQHFMLHIIPRKEGDTLNLNIPVNEFSEEDISKVRKDILDKIKVLFKLKDEVVEEKTENSEGDVEKEEAEGDSKPVKKKSTKKKAIKKSMKNKSVKENNDEEDNNEEDKGVVEEEKEEDIGEKETDEDEEKVSLDDIAKLLG